MANNFPIGNQIKLIRTIRELDLRAVAADSGINTAYLSMIENGKHTPTGEQLQKIEAALGIRFDNPEIQAAFAILSNIFLTSDGQPAQELPAQELPNAQ